MTFREKTLIPVGLILMVFGLFLMGENSNAWGLSIALIGTLLASSKSITVSFKRGDPE